MCEFGILSNHDKMSLCDPLDIIECLHTLMAAIFFMRIDLYLLPYGPRLTEVTFSLSKFNKIPVTQSNVLSCMATFFSV